MEAVAAGFATGARGAATARPFGLDLQAAAGGLRRRRATPMPAAGPRGGAYAYLPLATARSTISGAYGVSPRAAVGLESAGIVTGLDLEIGSHAVGLGLARSASMIQARPSYGHLACGRRVSHLPLRGFRRGGTGTHRPAAAVGLGGAAPGWLMVAAAVAGGGGSGSFGKTFAGVPLHIQAVYSPPRAQAVDEGAPSDDKKGEEKLNPIDEFDKAHPRLSTGFKLIGMGMCVIFCYLSAKGDPRAALLVTTLKDAGDVSKFLADVLLLLKKLIFPGPKR